LGRWVMEEACRRAAGWQRAHGRALTISVNLSARQLRDEGIVDDVAAALSASGLDASSLVLEITESALVHDTDTNASILTSLKRLGVRLAIDDFGTGYSSLA